MRHSSHWQGPEQHLNGASLDLGVMIGQLQAEMQIMRVEVSRQAVVLDTLMRLRAPEPRLSWTQEAREVIHVALAGAAIGLLIAGRIGAGDALALLKLALSGG